MAADEITTLHHWRSGPIYRIHGEDSVWAGLTSNECPILEICFSLIEGGKQTMVIRAKVLSQRVARKRGTFWMLPGKEDHYVETLQFFGGRYRYIRRK